MLRLIAGTLGWAGLGIIIAEVLNNLEMFLFKLNLWHALLPAAVFLLTELLIKQIAIRRRFAADDKYARARSFYQWIIGLIGLLFLLSIPFLWWEVIKKLAQMHP